MSARAIGVLLLVVGLPCAAYRVGQWQAAAACQITQATRDQAAATALATATDKAAARERQLNASLLGMSEQVMRKESDAAEKMQRFNADLRSGAVRLSVRTTGHCDGTERASATTAGESGREARSELVPADAEALVSIAADGDAAVRQLDAVIDAYNAARASCGQ